MATLTDLTLDDLADERYWVRWYLEPRAGDGAPTKVPYSPAGGKADPSLEKGRSTWDTKRAAERSNARALYNRPDDLGGIGIVLGNKVSRSEALGGIDLDSCIDEKGDIAAWALEIINRYDSYREISPSKRGVKIFFRYRIADKAQMKEEMGGQLGINVKLAGGDGHATGIEFYLGDRYFTVTRDMPRGSPTGLRLVERDDLLWMIKEVCPKFKGNGHDRSAQGKANNRQQQSRDSSRSGGDGGACTIAIRMRREGGDFAQMCDAIRDDPKTASWYLEKGVVRNERELHKVWEYAGSVTDADPKWERAQGKIIGNSQFNIRLAFDIMQVKVSYNSFAERPLIEGPFGLAPRYLGDAEANEVYLEIDERFFFRPTLEFFDIVIKNEARRKSFHPVRAYLDCRQPEWDGVKRIDTWLIDYCRAKDSPYVRAVGRIVMIAAVKRVRQPGCKFDEMLVLINQEQGPNKSSAIQALAVQDDWFSDNLPLSADTKVVLEQTLGKWIIEASELKGLTARTVDHLKAFLSRQRDLARLVWTRFPTERARQFIIIGTTNEIKFLRDDTGNRRFWPVAVGTIDIERLREDRDQLWAEAAAAEAQGESIRLDRTLWQEAADEQRERYIVDPWVDVIEQHLGEFNGKIRAAQAWEIIGVPSERRSQEHNYRLGKAMKANGWEHGQKRFGKGSKERKTAYFRGSKEEQEKEIIAYRDNHEVVVGYDEEYKKWREEYNNKRREPGC